MIQTDQHLRIVDLALEDRPREKLSIKGVQALSDSELLAILIGSGNKNETAVELSQRILYSVQNNLNALGKMTINDLTSQFKGIGEAKAITIIAALELGRRRRLSDAEVLVQIQSGEDVYNLFHPILGDLKHEETWVLLMNRSNKILKKVQMSKGAINGTLVDIRLILKESIDNLATNIILVHNHPSGNRRPSQEDDTITTKLKMACSYLDITLMDHLIVTDTDFYSYKENNKL